MTWYVNFFDEIYSKWENGISPDYRLMCKRQAEELATTLSINDKQIILNCGCGNGYHDYELKKYAKKVIGIDISSRMITIAKKNNPDIQYYNVDFLNSFSIGGKADLAILLNTTFGYSNENGQLESLTNIADNLTKDGKIVLDLMNPYLLFSDYKDTMVFREDECKIIQESSIDAFTQTITNLWTIFEKKLVSDRKMIIHYFFPNDIKRISELVDLRFENIYGDYKGNDYNFNSERMICVLSKNKSLENHNNEIKMNTGIY